MVFGPGNGGVQKLPGGIAPVLFRDHYGCMSEFRSPGLMRGEDIVSSQTGDHGKRQGKIPGGLRCSCAADIGIPVCGAAGPWIPRLLGAVSSGTASHLPFPHHPSRKDQPHREKPRHFRRSRSPPGSSGNRDRSEPSRQRSRCRYEDPIPVVIGGQKYLVVIPALVRISFVRILRIFSISGVFRHLWPFTDDSGSRDQDCHSSRNISLSRRRFISGHILKFTSAFSPQRCIPFCRNRCRRNELL